ncbi:MAG: heme ABC exporter ATP-binding protein CcmA [Actinomycetota bacterium]|nr:heme ABC exporter ATP-binding protein CcmA [Actinomycetota bacterium]
MITIEGLRVAYGRTIALDRIDAEIGPGVAGLFGPNGSGKSTLLRVLAGLLRPTSGTIRMSGELVDMKSERVRGRIGYAGHRSGLYRRLTVVENLELFARLYGTRADRVGEVIDQLDLADRRRTPAGDLSAGYQRRAAVARALLHEPDVLLLDEPYANLDDEAAESVSQAVMTWRRPGSVAVIATHGAKKVKRYADAGLILQHGRLIRQGTYEESGFTS